jgi:hypothetical protein
LTDSHSVYTPRCRNKKGRVVAHPPRLIQRSALRGGELTTDIRLRLTTPGGEPARSPDERQHGDADAWDRYHAYSGGVGFKSLKDTWADATSPHGRQMLTVLGGLVEFEREPIRACNAKERGGGLGALASSGPRVAGSLSAA